VVDEGDAVTQPLGLLEVVGGEQDRRALAVDPLDVLPQLEAQLDVDSGGGFVQDQQPRPVHERAGEGDPTLHAAGEKACALVALVGQREDLEQLGRARPAVALGHPEVAAVIVERLLDGEKEVQVELLGGQADALARLTVVVDRVVAEDLDRPRGRARQPGRAVDQGRLAGPVGSEQAEEVTGSDLQRDVLERLGPRRIALDEVLDGERGRRRLRGHPAGIRVIVTVCDWPSTPCRIGRRATA